MNADPFRPDPLVGQLNLTHVIYALHAFAVATGILTSASVIGSFLASLPSILAVILNYWNRGAVRGTWLESHFRWQIRTFWFAFLWLLLAILLAFTVLGIPLALFVAGACTVWIVYRVVRGWWCLSQRLMMPMPPAPDAAA